MKMSCDRKMNTLEKLIVCGGTVACACFGGQLGIYAGTGVGLQVIFAFVGALIALRRFARVFPDSLFNNELRPGDLGRLVRAIKDDDEATQILSGWVKSGKPLRLMDHNRLVKLVRANRAKQADASAVEALSVSWGGATEKGKSQHEH